MTKQCENLWETFCEKMQCWDRRQNHVWVRKSGICQGFPWFVLLCSENKSEETGANRSKSEQIGVFPKTRSANRRKRGNRNKSEQIGVTPFCRPQIGGSEKENILGCLHGFLARLSAALCWRGWGLWMIGLMSVASLNTCTWTSLAELASLCPSIVLIQWENRGRKPLTFWVFGGFNRERVNREVQTVNWEGGGEGAVARGVKSSLKKAHKPWIRGTKGAQTVN